MSENLTGRIQKLSKDVVDKIAAGEIIKRPVNVVKELIENSIDSNAKSISVTIADGGMKMIKIQDDGNGINMEDMHLLCERHTTSKISKFEELIGVESLGFRGEALSSISAVSRLCVTSKSINQDVAFTTSYLNTKMLDVPSICAGNKGTTITVQDLFYNDPIKAEACRNFNEEYRRILDLLLKYAIYHSGSISMTLRKSASPKPDIKTLILDDNLSSDGKVLLQKSLILNSFGIENEQVLINFSHTNEKPPFSFSCIMSHPSSSCRKTISIIFINGRVVDFKSLKLAIENLYKLFSPKTIKPFIYLDVLMDPKTVDVNCHPNKKDIIFLKQNEITNTLISVLSSRLETLGGYNLLSTNRQATKPQQDEKHLEFIDSMKVNTCDVSEQKMFVDASFNRPADNSGFEFFRDVNDKPFKNNSPTAILNSSLPYVVAPKFQVRTSPSKRKINSFYENSSSHLDKTHKVKSARNVQENIQFNREISSETPLISEKSSKNNSLSLHFGYVRNDINLTSISELQQSIRDSTCEYLKCLIKECILVGPIDFEFIIVQHQTSLYQLSFTDLVHNLFYQIVINNLGNFDYYSLSFNFDLKRLKTEKQSCDINTDSHKLFVNNNYYYNDIQNIVEFSKMLDDYFSIDINNEGILKKLPLILHGMQIDSSLLDLFMIYLMHRVNWESEKECLEDIAKIIAWLYTQSLYKLVYKKYPDTWRNYIEDSILPFLKEYLHPTTSMTHTKGMVTLLTTLPDLYKVFERC